MDGEEGVGSLEVAVTNERNAACSHERASTLLSPAVE